MDIQTPIDKDKPDTYYSTNTDEQPFVSISCLTYNHEQFITDTLEGFLKQKTTFPFEVLIHDDASTDGTADIIREYEEEYPQIIKSILQDENQYSKDIKVSSRFQHPRIKGKYYAICEGDDYWTDPYKLQKQVDFLEDNEEYAGCFSDFCIVDERDNCISKNGLEDYRKKDLSHLNILGYNTPKSFTAMVRSSAIPQELPNDFHKVKNGDTVFFALVSQQGPIGYIDFKCGNYRIHKKGVWSSMSSETQQKNQIVTSKIMMGMFTSDEEQKAVRQRLSDSLKVLAINHWHQGKAIRCFYYLFLMSWHKPYYYKLLPKYIFKKLKDEVTS